MVFIDLGLREFLCEISAILHNGIDALYDLLEVLRGVGEVLCDVWGECIPHPYESSDDVVEK